MKIILKQGIKQTNTKMLLKSQDLVPCIPEEFLPPSLLRRSLSMFYFKSAIFSLDTPESRKKTGIHIGIELA